MIYTKPIGKSWTLCDERGMCVHSDGSLAYHPDFFDEPPVGYSSYYESVWDKIPDYGDVFVLNDFLEMCKDGSIIDYDGIGYYGYSDKMSRVQAIPSEILKEGINDKFTHVIWFNK